MSIVKQLSRSRGALALALTVSFLGPAASISASGPAAAATLGGISIVTWPGIEAPPATLGASTMETVTQDDRTGQNIRTVPTPAGDITFNKDVTVAQVGEEWATWSHGFTGAVYVPTNGGDRLRMSLPAHTRSFYFYAEPNTFDALDITVSLTDGSASVTEAVEGEYGAQYFGFYATGTATIEKVQVESTDETFAVGEFGISAPKNSSYVALGDSYSSGEGAPVDGEYEDGKCHRSKKAWPVKVSKESDKLHLIANLACSGATTTALMENFKKQNPQLMDLEGIPSARTITVTMGGNDIGFGDLVADCVVFDACTDELDTAREQLKGPGGLSATLESAYAQIVSSAPYAELVVVGYPRIFPSKSEDKRRCKWLSDKELVAARRLVNRLDAMIESAAEEGGHKYVTVLDALAGHEECSVDPWMYPIGPSGGQQRAHPTSKGQAAIAEVVVKAIG